RNIMVYTTMKEIESTLSSAKFMRIHKSFIIPIAKISLLEKNFVVISSINEQIPIGKTYKPEMMNLVKHKLLSDRNGIE
ncbi:MAG: LytTR family transcriptional regulator, partial [Chitinophagaceae bacterium]|nr:LytTR family transcriptional regulator [Chitinophagaceae bacterium]